jgi:hypothetical protein
MAVHPGQYAELNLGPRFTGPGSHTPLNLGVDWSSPDPDPDPEPGLVGPQRGVGFLWKRAPTLARRIASGWSEAPSERSATRVPWGKAGSVFRYSLNSWRQLPRQGATVAAPWHQQVGRSELGASLLWASLARAGTGASAAWADLKSALQSVEARWRHLGPTIHGRALPFLARLKVQRHGRTAPWLHLPRRDRNWRMPWGQAGRLPWIVRPPVPPEPPGPPSPFPPGNYVGLNLGCPIVELRGFAPLNLGVNACYGARPRRRTYIVINDIEVVRLPDLAPIEVDGISISGDAGSWCLTLSMSLARRADLALLKPTVDGPREVRVTINGYVHVFIVEDYQSQRQFNAGGISVSGRSATALLGAPFAPARSKTTTEARTVAQLVNEELAGTGFTADYDTVDWEVPAGAWFYDGLTPIEAINRLAQASGAVVQSDPATRHLIIRPRYPVSPWTWPESTPDFILLDDIVTSETLQVRSAPMYNAVVVTGEIQGKGVTARVGRSSEPRTLYAPQASSPLINVDAAAQERGRNVISDRGEQASITLTHPLFKAPLLPGQTGRVLPLALGEVLEAGETWHGLCTGFQLEARADDKAVVVEQTITLERHYTNAD